MRENFTHYAAAKNTKAVFAGIFWKKRMAPALLGKISELALTARTTWVVQQTVSQQTKNQ